MAELNFYQRVAKVQQELKAPKDQNNDFGKYNYRTAEDILHNVKPLLVNNDLCLIIFDEIIHIEGRFYVKATVELNCVKTDRSIVCTGYAREAEIKKGMDQAQITGSSSTYARKYALQGLFLLDNSADDPDTKDNILSDPLTSNQIKQVNDLIIAVVGDNPKAQLEKAAGIHAFFKVKDIGEISQDNFTRLIEKLESQIR